MLISKMNENNLIDKNSACEKLVDFCLQTMKSKELKTIDLQKAIPAFYSFCYHKFQENNIEIKNIDYYSNEKPIGECFAYSAKNEIHFLKTLTQKEITTQNFIEILNTVFHESKHISDDYNPNLKSSINIPKKDAIGFYATYAESLAEEFTTFATNKLNLPTKVFNSVYANLGDCYNKLYNNNPIETSAENFAHNSTLEIINYGLNKNLSNEDKLLLEKMKSQQMNIIKKHQDTLQSYDEIVLSPLTKKCVNLFQKDMLDDLIKLTKNYNKETNKTKKLKYGNQIVTQLPILSHSLSINYNDEIAFEMAELTLSHIENGEDYELGHFSNTIAYCGYPPTDEQFSRLAKCYQSRNEEVIKGGNTPLTLFLEHLNKYYSNDFLLSIWSENNPNFVYDIESCKTELIQIDDTTKEDAIENYYSMQNEIDAEII